MSAGDGNRAAASAAVEAGVGVTNGAALPVAPARGRRRPAASSSLLAAALALACVAPAPAAAQDDAGTTATTLLGLTPSPRPLALGGAYAAVARDPLALFYNPARLALAGDAAHLGVAAYPADVTAGSIAGSWRIGPGALGVGVQFLDLGEVPEMVPDRRFGGQRGRPTGEEVGAGEAVVGAGYGASLGDGVHIGVAAKLLAVQIAEETATGVAFDAGAGYDVLADRVAVAVALQNLGGDFGVGRASPLPSTVRTGMTVRLGGRVGPRARLAADLLAREVGVSLATGIEAGFALAPDRAAVVRIGYDGRRRGVASTPLVVGGGVTAGRLSLDYAYRALEPLGVTHHFGLSIGVLP